MADLGSAFARGGVVGQINVREERDIARRGLNIQQSAVEQKRSAAEAAAQVKQVTALKEDTKSILEFGIASVNQATSDKLPIVRQMTARSFEGLIKRAEALGASPGIIIAAQNRIFSALSQKEAQTAKAAEVKVVETAKAEVKEAFEPTLAETTAREGAKTSARLSVTPSLVTFFIPSTKKTRTVNINDPAALNTVLDEGGIKFTATTEAVSPESAFALQDPEIREFREATIAAETVLTETARLRQQLRTGDTFTGLLGTTIRGFSGAVGNLVQLARRQHGKEEADKQLSLLDPTQYAESLQIFVNNLGDAAQSQAFQSNVINLAFMLARAAEPGGRLSDKDVQAQMRRLAAGSGDQNQILASLNEVDRATKSSFVIRHRVFGGSEVLGEIPASLRVGGGVSPTDPAGVPAVDLTGTTDEELLQMQRSLSGGATP